MAIHQRGFQWQAITRLPDSSACCLHCYCSLGPRLPNSPWKQYLYIYKIFTQYLPRCKTISYLTINLPMFFGFFSPTRSFKALSQHPSLYHTPFLLAFFFLRSSVWVFSSECLNFIFLFFQKIIFFSSCLFFFLVYRWNWIFFLLLSYGGQSPQQLPSHSKAPQFYERKKYWRESIKKQWWHLSLSLSHGTAISYSACLHSFPFVQFSFPLFVFPKTLT